MKERTVRDWLQRGTAPGTRQRRKYQSDFDPYAPYVLKRWQEGCRNGLQLWREVAAQGYPGSVQPHGKKIRVSNLLSALPAWAERFSLRAPSFVELY
jgi:transposase